MNDESQPTPQTDIADAVDADLAVATMLKDNRKETRPRKPRKSRHYAKKHAKQIYDPVNDSVTQIPQTTLPTDATTKALVKRVNDLTSVIQIQSTLMMHWREMIQAARQTKYVPVDVISKLAAAGASQKTIANLLSFNVDTFKTRKDIYDAWVQGHAELELVLGEAQIKTALKGNPLMQIFLGKQILGQQDTPTTVIQNNVGTDGSSLRTKVREAREKAKEEWRKAVEDQPPIDAEYTEVKANGTDGTTQ